MSPFWGFFSFFFLLLNSKQTHLRLHIQKARRARHLMITAHDRIYSDSIVQTPRCDSVTQQYADASGTNTCECAELHTHANKCVKYMCRCDTFGKEFRGEALYHHSSFIHCDYCTCQPTCSPLCSRIYSLILCHYKHFCLLRSSYRVSRGPTSHMFISLH